MMQPPPAPLFTMNNSFPSSSIANMEDYGLLEETQPTQPTQLDGDYDSQPVPEINTSLWGYLIPCNSRLGRIEFDKIKLSFWLGRHASHNDFVLAGQKISNRHCTISWNGKSDTQSEVTVFDNSSNGTFINGTRIGKGRQAFLSQGDEIAFGSPIPGTPGMSLNGPFDDYRFIYRHQGENPPVGGVFVEYDIGSELGKGSFATVLRATHRATGEIFAVKLINTKRFQLAANPHTARMFLREIEILLSLHHPNIVHLRQIYEDESSIALVMEFVRGGDLLDYILQRGGLPETDTQHIARQMCEAMSYIHSHNIAHRDLKPENVLLSDSTPVIAKIADFGLAKAVDSNTFLKTMCGTPSYLAPEVVLNGENRQGYNHLVDSWSMGVIVFSMLTNTSPFVEEDNEQATITARIRNRTVEWPNLHRAGVSRIGLDFVERLLMNDPERRMSLSDALRHPWLASVQYDPESFPPLPPRDPNMISIISTTLGAGIGLPRYHSERSTASPPPETGTHEASIISVSMPNPLPAEQSGLGHDFQNLNIQHTLGGEPSMLLDIPGAFPLPPNGPSASNGLSQAAGPPGTKNGKRVGKRVVFEEMSVIPDSQPLGGDSWALLDVPATPRVEDPDDLASPSKPSTSAIGTDKKRKAPASEASSSELSSPPPEDYDPDSGKISREGASKRTGGRNVGRARGKAVRTANVNSTTRKTGPKSPIATEFPPDTTETTAARRSNRRHPYKTPRFA